MVDLFFKTVLVDTFRLQIHFCRLYDWVERQQWDSGNIPIIIA